jgi:hypothetical protein
LIAYLWPFRVFKDHAAIIGGKMDAGYAGRLSIRHPGNGRGDGGSYATSSAEFTTFHKKWE